MDRDSVSTQNSAWKSTLANQDSIEDKSKRIGNGGQQQKQCKRQTMQNKSYETSVSSDNKIRSSQDSSNYRSECDEESCEQNGKSKNETFALKLSLVEAKLPRKCYTGDGINSIDGKKQVKKNNLMKPKMNFEDIKTSKVSFYCNHKTDTNAQNSPNHKLQNFAKVRPKTEGHSDGKLHLNVNVYRRAESALTCNDLKRYRHMYYRTTNKEKSTEVIYKDKTWHQARKTRIRQKIDEIRKRKNLEMENATRRKLNENQEAAERQKQQLRYVRNKHTVAKEKRFATQHVKWKFVKKDSVNRSMYGLPNDA
ncbi:unnamed protein product [Clavelina lepadiformis]|uniref:Uncharacterized protein n=1 Tax=Clavelina lepadiformis TaxID=159417 RepID=A0ABP0GD03_CLALP